MMKGVKREHQLLKLLNETRIPTIFTTKRLPTAPSGGYIVSSALGDIKKWCNPGPGFSNTRTTES